MRTVASHEAIVVSAHLCKPRHNPEMQATRSRAARALWGRATPLRVASGVTAAAAAGVQRVGEEAGTTITVVPVPVRPVSPLAPS
jgi:negative regulator of sigma E activity